jgi:tetratricopeptide (TPR) repeat protein
MKSGIVRCGAAALWPLAGLMLLATLSVPAARDAYAQEPGGRYRVLVVPMESRALDRRFGDKVADEIRERLADFPTHAPVEERDFKRALKQYDLEAEELNAIRARQLANLMGAQVLYFATLEGVDGVFEVNGTFIDVRTGDEVPVPPVRVSDRSNESVDRVAEVTIEAFEEQVRFVRAQQFCAEYVESHQLESALRNCDEALEINPNSVHVLFNKGMAYRVMFEQAETGSNGWADSSIAYFEMVLERQPSHRAALQNAAFMYSQAGEADKASELYQRYLEYDAGNVPVRIKVAYDLANAGLMAEAIAIIQAGLEIAERDVDLLQSLGDYALRHSSADSSYVDIALEAYEQVLEIEGEETDLVIVENALAAYTQANRTAEAIAFAELALQSHSESARLWSLYADALGRAERYDDASAAMERVVEIEPEYPSALLKRGRFKLQGGDAQAALADFDLAIETGASTSEEVFRLFWGEAHGARSAGDQPSAIGHFATAARYAPADQRRELEFWWGYSYYQLGERQATPEGASVSVLQRARSNVQAAQGHFQRAGNVRREVPQLLDACERWLLNIDARIRRAQRGNR